MQDRTSPAVHVLLVCAVLLPVVVAFQVMCTHWVAVPFWDAWHTPGEQIASWCRGTLTLRELFSQHNEHRPFFPRLVYLPLAIAFGWDVRREMMSGFLLLCSASAALYFLLRRTGSSRPASLCALAVMNLLLFTPRQYDNLLAGMDGGSFLPAVALLWALVINLSPISLARKTAANAALAFVSTYTFGNGMLLWALAFPWRNPTADADQPRLIACRAVYLGAAVASIAFYFVGYEHPPLAPPPANSFADAPLLLEFVLRWLGSVFFLRPLLVGTVAAVAFVTLALVVRSLARAEMRDVFAWCILAAYVLLSGVITARARLGFGFAIAGDARYTAYTPFFYIALVGLSLGLWRRLRSSPKWRPLAIVVGSVSLAALVVLSATAYARQRLLLAEVQKQRQHLRSIVERTPLKPDNPELALLSPYPETADTIRTLAACGVLRPARDPAAER